LPDLEPLKTSVAISRVKRRGGRYREVAIKRDGASVKKEIRSQTCPFCGTHPTEATLQIDFDTIQHSGGKYQEASRIRVGICVLCRDRFERRSLLMGMGVLASTIIAVVGTMVVAPHAGVFVMTLLGSTILSFLGIGVFMPPAVTHKAHNHRTFSFRAPPAFKEVLRRESPEDLDE
jgi:hypothetical protein